MTIIDDLKTWGYSPSNLPTQFFNVLADNVTDAFSSMHADVATELRDDLASLAAVMLESAPQLISLLTASKEDANYKLAYQIGEINFAQRLATSQADRKLKNEFIQEAQSEKYSSYLRLLAEKDCSNAELIKLLNFYPETISRRLKILRGWGLTDFRRDGKQVINFITQAGKNLIQTQREALHSDNSSEKLTKILKEMQESSSVPFQEHKSFALAA